MHKEKKTLYTHGSQPKKPKSPGFENGDRPSGTVRRPLGKTVLRVPETNASFNF